ncbi:hypothetical protein D3C87_1580190 [compost metagenome]
MALILPRVVNSPVICALLLLPVLGTASGELTLKKSVPGLPFWSRPWVCCSLNDKARPTANWPSWFCIRSSDDERNCNRPPSVPPVISLSSISTATVLPAPAGKV